MLWSLLTFGSLTFWLISLGVCGAVIAAVENERGIIATFSFLIYLAIIQLFSDFSVVSWLSANFYWVLLAGLLYFVVGSVWGIFKWSLFVSKKASENEENYREARKNFIRVEATRCPASIWAKTEIGLDTQVPDPLKSKWQNYVSGDHIEGHGAHYGSLSLTISPKHYKSTILTWMSFWPASLTWTLINDPIRAAFRHIYAYLSNTLESISKKAFADLKNLHQQDTQVPPTPPKV